MADLADGESTEMQGSGAKPYVLRNVGGVYSCSCPAWRNQSVPIERRTCKHLRKLRGDEAEQQRIGSLPATAPPRKPKAAPAAGASPQEGGEAESELQVLLANTWEPDLDPKGWWMSEKLDGVRAYWDGKQFLSRQGNVYHAPEWFMAGLPTFPLDGELWVGRKQFQRTVSIARRQDKSNDWKELRYLVFDAPDIKQPFEARIAELERWLESERPPFARFHPHQLCEGTDHLRKELLRVEGLGGEGMMLRQPGSMYVRGRSSTLLKVKTFKDAEAKVVGHAAGAGKFKGVLGALEVEMADGTLFSVGTGFSDKERKTPPPVGSIITFRYQELSKDGVPRFPSFLRVRTDVD
jgi:DNA ligase 1